MSTLQPGTASSSIDYVGGEESIITAKGAVKDIMFGSIAGMVAEIFEYPFDLAKVRLQAQLLTPSSSSVVRFNGPMDCLMQTWKQEGVQGLYRGLPAPIVGSMAETASLFLAYSAFQNVIRTFASSSTAERLTIPQLGLAAGGAGFLTSFVLTPIELVKCKMQVQMMNFHPVKPAPAAPGRIPRRTVPILPSSSSSSSYTPPSPSLKRQAHTHTRSVSYASHISKLKTSTPTLITTGRLSMHDLAYKSSTIIEGTAATAIRPPGPIALIRSIVVSYGVRGLWLGHTGTLVRETGGTAAWFVAKEYVARQLVERRVRRDSSHSSGGTNTELLAWESAASGAIAGAVGALMFYPADTVKSAIQTEEELRPRGARRNASRNSFVGTFRKMWARHGVRGLYAGCGMTVARAVPSSGIIFVVYDGLTAYVV